MNLNDYKLPKVESIIDQDQVCSICLTDINENIKYTKCNHIYHKECIKNYIIYNINNSESNITCPTIKNNIKCDKIFSYDDIKIITDNSLGRKVILPTNYKNQPDVSFEPSLKEIKFL